MKSILCDLNLHCTQHMISIHRGNMPQLLVRRLFRSFNLNFKKKFFRTQIQLLIFQGSEKSLKSKRFI